jgi:hypothetical protein
MRTLLTVKTDVSASNKAVMDGSLARLIQSTMERIKPEAAYFCTQDGNRGCFMVFDLKDPSDIPVIAEPLFQGLNAKLEFIPVMNIEDLQKGLSQLQQPQ